MNWEIKTQEKFGCIISKIPVFHRHIAEKAVRERAEDNAHKRNAASVEEQDLVSAFFSDVPTPFYSMMIRLLDDTGIDYKKYGFPKTP